MSGELHYFIMVSASIVILLFFNISTLKHLKLLKYNLKSRIFKHDFLMRKEAHSGSTIKDQIQCFQRLVNPLTLPRQPTHHPSCHCNAAFRGRISMATDKTRGPFEYGSRKKTKGGWCVPVWSSVCVAKHECYFVLQQQQQQQQQVLPCQHNGFNSIALTKINRLMIRNSSFEWLNYWINFLSQLKYPYNL